MSVKAIQELIEVSGDVDDLRRAEVAERAAKEVDDLLELIGLIYYAQSMTVSEGKSIVAVDASTMERIQATYEGRSK